MDAHNTQYWAHCAPPIDAYCSHRTCGSRPPCTRHPIHACALVRCVVVVSLHLSPFSCFFPLLFFQPFQMSSSEFHERLRSNPLCDFRLGTVATSDHETPSQIRDTCTCSVLFHALSTDAFQPSEHERKASTFFFWGPCSLHRNASPSEPATRLCQKTVWPLLQHLRSSKWRLPWASWGADRGHSCLPIVEEIVEVVQFSLQGRFQQSIEEHIVETPMPVSRRFPSALGSRLLIAFRTSTSTSSGTSKCFIPDFGCPSDSRVLLRLAATGATDDRLVRCLGVAWGTQEPERWLQEIWSRQSATFWNSFTRFPHQGGFGSWGLISSFSLCANWCFPRSRQPRNFSPCQPVIYWPTEFAPWVLPARCPRGTRLDTSCWWSNEFSWNGPRRAETRERIAASSCACVWTRTQKLWCSKLHRLN